jgi:Transcriptional regulator
MNAPPPLDVMGLRERKKAKTRRSIQEHALRLFEERGYDSTTVEQIAEAAQVSTSTFFRYFPTKEDVVLHDDHSLPLCVALAAQPEGIPMLTALRNTFREVLGRIPQAEMTRLLARSRLLPAIPALHGGAMRRMFATIDPLSRIVGARLARDPGDPRVQVLCGAIIGALVRVLCQWTEQDGRRPLADMVDEAIDYLEQGFRP